MKKETGILLFLVFTNLCWGIAIVLYDREAESIKAELRACVKREKEIEIGFVIDARERPWIKIRHGENVKAICCEGDSIFFMTGNSTVDTIFTKVTISDLLRVKQ